VPGTWADAGPADDPPGQHVGAGSSCGLAPAHLSVPVEIPLQCRHGGRVQVSRAVAASADPDLERANGACAQNTVGPDMKPALQGPGSRRAEDAARGDAEPALGRADRHRTYLAIDGQSAAGDAGDAGAGPRHGHLVPAPVGPAQSGPPATLRPGAGPLYRQDPPGDCDLGCLAGSMGMGRVAGATELSPGRRGELQSAVEAVPTVDGPVATALAGGHPIPDRSGRLGGRTQSDAGEERRQDGNGDSDDAVGQRPVFAGSRNCCGC